MSRVDAAFADMHDALFDEFGEDATVSRGGGAPVPVRVFIERGIERRGEFGQVVARVTTANFRNSEWQPQQGDTLNLASGARRVAAPPEKDDGYVTTVVLHG